MSTGVYQKYKITKADGSPVDPEATYFVLRLDTDPAARAAARRYVDAVAADNDQLAGDILRCVDALEDGPCGCRTADECWHDFGSGVWRAGQ